MTGQTVALTGATGFIGRRTTLALQQAGHVVRAIARPGRASAVEDGATVIEGAMEDAQAQATLLEGADVLVHNAVDWKVLKAGDMSAHLRNNLCAAIDLFDAAARKGCPIVFVSSVAVHHHMLEAFNSRIDHVHPARPGNLYGALKAALEAHLWAMHTRYDMGFVALRPAAVYGIDPTPTRSIGWPLVQRLSEGRSWGRAGGGKFVHVNDVAAAIAAAVDHRRRDGRLYHLADCYARWSDWEAMAVDVMDMEMTVEHVSPDAPKNQFVVDDLASDLGVSLDRGHDGIREHLANLVDHWRSMP
ncbi:MAG: NAD(P)-dependent oxidoreductase [Phycisphaerales bacterium]|nr:NAD(P)-dependent oxidoreductase [Phycisphaerales bacterium]